jgi:hypothetical protein
LALVAYLGQSSKSIGQYSTIVRGFHRQEYRHVYN